MAFFQRLEKSLNVLFGCDDTEARHKQELEEERQQREFLEKYGVTFTEAYNDPENRKRWDSLMDAANRGEIRFVPDYHSFIFDGDFKK